MESLKDFLASVRPAKEFEVAPIVDLDSDTLSLVFEDVPYFAVRVDRLLTVYKNLESSRLVGFELKGIYRKMKRLKELHVWSDNSHLNILLMGYMAEAETHGRPTYEELLQRSRAFRSLHVPSSRSLAARQARIPTTSSKLQR